MNQNGEVYTGQAALWQSIKHFSKCVTDMERAEAVVLVENAITAIKEAYAIEQQRTIDDLQAKLELAQAAMPKPEPCEESRYATEIAADEDDDVEECLQRMEIKRLRGALQYIAQWDTQTRPKNEYTELAMKAFAKAILDIDCVAPVLVKPPEVRVEDLRRRAEEMFKDRGNEVPHNGVPAGWKVDEDDFFTRELGNDKVVGTLYEPALTGEVMEVFIDSPGVVFARSASAARRFDKAVKPNAQS